MPRQKNPLSETQISQRARRLKDPAYGWLDRVLGNVALACLRAQGWIEYLDDPNSGADEPLPALPDGPGETVRVDGVRLDLTTPEGWARLREVSAGLPAPGKGATPPSLHSRADALAAPLRERVVSHLTPGFFRGASEWIGEVLAAGPQASAWVMTPDAQDLWSVPRVPLGLPPAAVLGPLEERHPDAREQIAENAAAWVFARHLYRSAVDSRPDALGRRGLERPAVLRALLEDLGVVEPLGERPAPLAEQADNGGVVRMASGAPVSVATTALMRPDRWENDALGGLYRHEREQSRSKYELRLQHRKPAGAGDALVFYGLARCQEMLEGRGLDVAGLHGVLCCYVAQLPDPSATIELDGHALLEDLGLSSARNGRDGSTTSDLLKRLGGMATLLGAIWCGDGESKGRHGWVTTEQGPLWNVSIRTDGVSRQLDLGVSEGLASSTITDLTLIVSGGAWIRSHLNREALAGGEGLYQFVPVALAVLQLSRYRSELAFRLGMHLSLRYRTNPSAWQNGRIRVRIGQLLSEVLPEPKLQRALAKGNREQARLLKDEIFAALTVLAKNVGFRFEWPKGHPPALIPEGLRDPEAGAGPTPNGALDKLLGTWVTIVWPERVVEARHATALRKVEERQDKRTYRQRRALTASPPKPAGAVLREAIEQAKQEGFTTGYRDLAPQLGVSAGQLSKLVNGKKELPERELQRMLTLLGVRRHQRTARLLRRGKSPGPAV